MSESTVQPAAAIKVSAAAERLDMSRRSLERHIAVGRVRVVRLGRSVRVPVTEIERLLAGNSSDARTAE